MPWTEVSTMDEKRRFIDAWTSRRFSVAELAEHFQISRKSAYKWIDRFREGGNSGLQDRSHARKTQPHRMHEDTEKVLLELKAKYPRWGPKKIRKKFELVDGREQAGICVPAASTIGDLFSRHDLVTRRTSKRPHQDMPRALREATEPNGLWAIDFKGERPLGDGSMCYPLTVSDDFSRYLLVCHGLQSVEMKGVKPLMERAFREYGMPAEIRSDCGSPFAHRNAVGGLTRLSVWWLRLGIRLQRTDPGKPQQNGRHERMHRTLKAATMLPVAASAKPQQARFDSFRCEYNDERPHEAIDMCFPSDWYKRSPRAFPDRLPEPDYPKHFLRRQVSSIGNIKLRGNQLFIGAPLALQHVGLEATENGWRVYFFSTLLAEIDEETLVVTVLK